jgi:acyl-CoA thioesterase-1
MDRKFPQAPFSFELRLHRLVPWVMKIVSTFAFVFALLIFAGRLVMADPPEPIDLSKYSGPVQVACVGDSITQGTGMIPGTPWPPQLQKLLGDKWDVKNFAVSGRTVLRSGDSPLWKEQAFKDAHDFKPDVVIIMLGTNDTKPQNWVHSDQLVTDYEAMIDSFQQLDSKPHVYICRPPPIGGNILKIDASKQTLEMPMFDQIATDKSVPIIDVNGALKGHEKTMIDNVHPNTEGESYIAKLIFQTKTGNPTPYPGVVKGGDASLSAFRRSSPDRLRGECSRSASDLPAKMVNGHDRKSFLPFVRLIALAGWILPSVPRRTSPSSL